MRERNEQIRQLALGIERLPQTAQLVLALHYNEGLNFREVGAVLDLTESEVRKLRNDALARLAGGARP